MGQNRKGSEAKNGNKGSTEQIESTNQHNANTTRILILMQAFTTENTPFLNIYYFPNQSIFTRRKKVITNNELYLLKITDNFKTDTSSMISSYGSNHSVSIKKMVFQLVISSSIIIVAIFLIILSSSIIMQSNKLLKEQISFIEFLSTLIGVILILISNMFIIKNYYRSKYKNNDTQGIFQTDKIEFLQSVRNKVIVGLENIRTDVRYRNQDPKILPLSSTPVTMLEHFSPEIQCEIQTEIKGKTIFTLIEIAYQDPSETNPTRLSKSLHIPLSSLSREIKKLISLNYLKPHVSRVVLHDGRLKNFTITPKGFDFLSNLNNALKITIDRLKSTNI
ncbi:MAG: hypothetical protein ACFFDT_10855, partial [Candidatus Hodarchaeota archaeon]